jgi:hypothetical protein
MKTERMMQPSAYSQLPRRRRGDVRVAKDGLEALAEERAPIDVPTDGPVSSAVKHLRAIVERLLEQTPGDALCDACLAFAAEAALIDMRHATGELPQMRAGIERGTGRCVSCRRETVVTVFRTAAAV